MLNPGDQVQQWKIVRLLGEGAMAYVYEAENTSLKRLEAVKFLKPHVASDPNLRARFIDEAVHAARLNHPNIARVFSVSMEDPERSLLAMQLIKGPDLEDLLAESGPLQYSDAVGLIRQLALAIDCAHTQNLIHRDIKPANILLERHSSGWHPYIVDFGIARAFDQSGNSKTQAGMIIGTPDYMAPEQADSSKEVTFASDQYALACVAYKILAGCPPFGDKGSRSDIQVLIAHMTLEATPLIQYVPGLPLAAQAALAKAFSKEPSARFSSCSEFAEAFAGNSSVQLPPPPPPPPTQLPVKTRTNPLVAATIVLVFLGVSMVGIALSQAFFKGDGPVKIDNSASSGDSVQAQPLDEPAQSPVDAPEPIVEKAPDEALTQQFHSTQEWSSDEKPGMPLIVLRTTNSVPKYVTVGKEVVIGAEAELGTSVEGKFRGSVALEIAKGPASLLSGTKTVLRSGTEVTRYVNNLIHTDKIIARSDIVETYSHSWKPGVTISTRMRLKVSDTASPGDEIHILIRSDVRSGIKGNTGYNVAPRFADAMSQQGLPAAELILTVR